MCLILSDINIEPFYLTYLYLHYRETMEFAFQGVYQELKHLSALTKKQTKLLGKCIYSKEVISEYRTHSYCTSIV